MTSNRPVTPTGIAEPAHLSDVAASAGFGSMIEHVAPLFPAAAGMILGIAVDNQLRSSPSASWVAYTFVLILGALTLWRRAFATLSRPLGLFAMAIGVGGLLHLNAQRIPDPNGIAQHVTPDASIVRLIGTVASEPRVLIPRETPFSRWSFRGETMAFVLRAESVATSSGWTPVRDCLRVLVREPVLDLRAGEQVEITGFVSPLTPPRNPGAHDWSNWHRRQGITAYLTCPHRDNVQRLNPLAVRRGSWISSLRTGAASLVTEGAVGAEEESGLLDALVLGQRSEINRSVNDAFVKAGCVHFLAASGTNVAMVASFVWFLGRWLQLTRRGGALCVFAAIVLYALLAEPRPPILRAAITGTLFCFAVAAGRERSVLNWLSAAAIVLLIVDPTTAFDLGFQLSFLAVLGVAYLTGPMTLFLSGEWILSLRMRRQASDAAREDSESESSLRPPRGTWWTHAWQIAATYLAASLAAWLAGMPIVAGTFHRIQPYGAIGSCLVLPLVYLAMLIGFLRAAIAFVLPVGGELLGLVLRELVAALLSVVKVLAGLPGATVEVTGPPWWWTSIFYSFLITVVLRSRMSWLRRAAPECIPNRVAWVHAPAGTRASRTERGVTMTSEAAGEGALSKASEDTRPLRADPCHPEGDAPAGPESKALPSEARRRSLRAAAIILGVAAAVATGAWAWPRSVPEELIITVLSVGDGSAVVLELPNGETNLLDAGSRSFADVGRDVVRPFLLSRGIASVDEVLLTRARLDHFNGVPSALENSSGVLVRTAPGFTADCAQHASCRELLKLLKTAGHNVDPSVEPGGSWERGGARFQWITAAESSTRSDAADGTAAIRIEFAGHSILFASDVDRRTCSVFFAFDTARADALVAPGSTLDLPECRPFLDHVGARILVRIHPTRSNAASAVRSDSLAEREVFDLGAGGAVRIVIDACGVRARYALGDTER